MDILLIGIAAYFTLFWVITLYKYYYEIKILHPITIIIAMLFAPIQQIIYWVTKLVSKKKENE